MMFASFKLNQFFIEPKSKRNLKLKEIYDSKLKLLEQSRLNDINLINMEENLFFKEKELNSLTRCQTAELND